MHITLTSVDSDGECSFGIASKLTSIGGSDWITRNRVNTSGSHTVAISYGTYYFIFWGYTGSKRANISRIWLTTE